MVLASYNGNGPEVVGALGGALDVVLSVTSIGFWRRAPATKCMCFMTLSLKCPVIAFIKGTLCRQIKLATRTNEASKAEVSGEL